MKVKLPGITEQDKADILFGIQQEFDYIAASFVRDAKAIREIRQLLDENGGQDIGIIARLRMQRALRISTRSLRQQMELWLPEVILEWRFLRVRFPTFRR